MERPSKRRRLFAPLNSELSQSLDTRDAYDEKPDELHEEENELANDPDHDLQQKRARLDLKLKSTFESIFEKYGKSFDGVGDEIDLYTGEILVDNGHLLQMQSEIDAGDPLNSGRIPRTLAGSVNGDYEDEDEDDEDEDDDNEGALDDDDMMEDDMILRGFAQARQFMERRPQNTFGIGISGQESRRVELLHQPSERSTLPSQSNILSQFGPELGPQIMRYVSQQATFKDGYVEPMWRAPPISPTASVERPVTKSGPIQPEVERSMSPDNSPSLWAPQRSSLLADDDDLLRVFVAKARRIGLDLSDHASWKRLEDMVSRIPEYQDISDMVHSILDTAGRPGSQGMRRSPAVCILDKRINQRYQPPGYRLIRLSYQNSSIFFQDQDWTWSTLPPDVRPSLRQTNDQPGLENELHETPWF